MRTIATSKFILVNLQRNGHFFSTPKGNLHLSFQIYQVKFTPKSIALLDGYFAPHVYCKILLPDRKSVV